ncbi:MAG TPA: hypothetical protein VNH17_03010 [Streptosporangiaceae bacterium]|nr:hypothetical protein [Streptosporangiaceae bacterium]
MGMARRKLHMGRAKAIPLTIERADLRGVDRSDPETKARFDAMHADRIITAARAAADRASLAATPIRAATLVTENRQGPYGDFEDLLVNPHSYLLKRWLNRSLILDHQYVAGGMLWSSYYRGGLDGAKALDPTREFVDGGGYKGTPDHRLDALAEWNAVVRTLSRMSACLCVEVSCLEMDVAQLEAVHPEFKRKGYAMVRVREALDDLARHYRLMR